MLHEESLAQFGGASGLRDEGLLDSALARPLHIQVYNSDVYNSDCRLAGLAAAYARGIAKNHAFVDGNKRAGFLAIGLFLFINGYRLVAGQVDAINMMLGVASGDVEEAALAAWIADHMVPR
jgi:death-on-curing protein